MRIYRNKKRAFLPTLIGTGDDRGGSTIPWFASAPRLASYCLDGGLAMYRLLLGLLMLAMPAAAEAEWMEAQSAHFIVYADDKPKDIERFAGQLELFHAALTELIGREAFVPSPSNRVTVYVVKNTKEVRRLFGEGNDYIGGFYIPRAGGSLAIVPQIRVSNRNLDFSMITLLHEYTHHFMASVSPFQLPRWYNEGTAEFFASAEFTSDGGISLGRPANHRGAELAFAEDVTAAQLLDPDAYEADRGRGYDAFYGKSWALFHYLTFEEERRGQLRTYMAEILQGKRSVDAAKAAFGDLGRLERDLDAYLRRRRMNGFVFAPGKLETAPVTLRALRAGEAEIMPVRIRSKRGVTRETAGEILVDAREIAARYKDDPAVLAELAEAEFDAGNSEAAIAAADAALALDPTCVNAYVQKGYALFRMAEEHHGGLEEFSNAVKPFLALNKLENDHPLPLIFFNRSYVESGRELTDTARQALERAAELSPFDLSLRFNLGLQQVHGHDYAKARMNLAPVAYNPHGGRTADVARTVLDRIESEKPLEDGELDILLATPSAPALDTGTDE